MTVASNSPLRDPLVTRPDLESLAKRTVLGSLTAFLSQVAKLSIQICGQIILARMLFPSDFGLVAMVYPLTNLAQVFNDIGLGHAIVQRQRLEQGRLSTLFWVNMALSCMLACSVAAMAPVPARMVLAVKRRTELFVASMSRRSMASPRVWPENFDRYCRRVNTTEAAMRKEQPARGVC